MVEGKARGKATFRSRTHGFVDVTLSLAAEVVEDAFCNALSGGHVVDSLRSEIKRSVQASWFWYSKFAIVEKWKFVDEKRGKSNKLSLLFIGIQMRDSQTIVDTNAQPRWFGSLPKGVPPIHVRSSLGRSRFVRCNLQERMAHIRRVLLVLCA